MKGLGCNEQIVLNILCKRSNAQRQEIRRQFRTLFGQDLLKQLKSELKGDFGNTIIALMYTPPEYDAVELKKAMKGLGTDEAVLIEILTSRTNRELRDLIHAYQLQYGEELEHAVRSETSGDFKNLLVSLCTANRDESIYVNVEKAKADAQALFDAGEKKLGTDESVFNMIIATQSPAQLNMVFTQYGKVSGHDINVAIEREFSSDIKTAYLSIIKCMRNRPAYFAEMLYNAMKGLGTDDNTLIRIIVSRSEIDLNLVKQEFYSIYKKSLEDFVKSETSGKYKDALLAIIRGN
ncbi:unnamed protein product [Soboliphyme baturini]|uniref:Annexin n=1 Tax=Soboliphyme baturini TaxID=241478 RepID=A0A183ITH1_9BILA|nr:unnamed protein product [Soboliphyme baturini]